MRNILFLTLILTITTFAQLKVGFNFLTSDKTLNFTTANNRAFIQASIDSIPKNLGGKTLKLKFAAGTYDFGAITDSAALTIKKFINGEIIVEGVANTGTTFPTQISHSSTVDWNATFNVTNCQAVVNIRYFRLTNSSTNTTYGIMVQNASNAVIKWCYFELPNKNIYSASVYAYNFSNVTFGGSYLIRGYTGAYAWTGSTIFLNENYGNGDNPTYGGAAQGSVVYRYGTQPSTSIFEYAGKVY